MYNVTIYNSVCFERENTAYAGSPSFKEEFVKKLLVILLALCVVGGAFAQATVNGYVRAVNTYSDGAIALATRARLNVSYTTEDDIFKAYVRLQSSDMAAPGVSYAYARVNLLDGKVVVSGGKLANYDYDISSGLSDYASGGNVASDGLVLDAAQAMLVQFLPVEGLNVGIGAFAGALALDQLYVAAKYEMADLGAVIVESRLAAALADSRASASVQFTGVEGLTASAGFKMNSDVGYHMGALAEDTVFGIINYAAGDLTVEVAPEFRLAAGQLYLEGYVSYAMEDLTFNVLGAYDAGASADTIGATFFGGVEAYYNVGKGQVMAGFYYDDVNSWSVPLVVKVSF